MIGNFGLKNAIVSLLGMLAFNSSKALSFLRSPVELDVLMCQLSKRFRERSIPEYKLGKIHSHAEKTSYFCLRCGSLAPMDGLYFLPCRFETAPAKLVTIKGDLYLDKYALEFV